MQNVHTCNHEYKTCSIIQLKHYIEKLKHSKNIMSNVETIYVKHGQQPSNIIKYNTLYSINIMLL